jgi:hypothetical protein
LWCQVKTPPDLSPGARDQAIIERKEWSAFVFKRYDGVRQKWPVFLVKGEMPVIETWGSINRDPGIFFWRVK